MGLEIIVRPNWGVYTRQSLDLPAFVIPGPLPPRVQRIESYTRAELEQFTVPDTDLERCLRRTLDYMAYRDRYLATSLGVERELERQVAAAGAGGGAARGETGVRGRDGRSSRGRGRGSRPPAGGQGASLPGRGEGDTRVLETVETSAPPGLPSLEWTIGMTGSSGVREVTDIPRLSQPPMRLPAQVPREWAEKAVMLMVGMRHLLKKCVKGKVLQTRPVPEPASPVTPQVQPRRSARTQPQVTTSSPASVSTRGRGTQRVSRPAAEARQFEVLPRAASQWGLVLEESGESGGDTEDTNESSE